MPKLFSRDAALGQNDEPGKPGMGQVMKEAYERSAATDGQPWKSRDVAQKIIDCRSNCRGIPLFRPKFAKEQLRVDGKPAVLMICLKGKKGCPGTFFTDVPPETVRDMENRSGEWRYFLQKWDEEDALTTDLRQRIGEALTAEVNA